MTITYPIDFPTTVGIARFSAKMQEAVPELESSFDYSTQSVSWGGQRWLLEVELPEMSREQADEMCAFLLKLRGRYGTFLIGDPARSKPRGLWGGSVPQVDGGGQTGGVLNVKNLAPSLNNVARVGDYIQLGIGANARLHRVLDDAGTDTYGKMSINICPNIRVSPSDGEYIIIDGARGHFKLTSNINGEDIQAGDSHTISFTAKEAL